MVNESKKKLYLIGHPVEHSLSPVLHNSLSEIRGINYEYEAVDVLTEDLEHIMNKFKEQCQRAALRYEDQNFIKSNFVNSYNIDFENCVGFNVTSPHKVKIIKYLDILDDSALKTGSVNTVVVENMLLKGYNTDVYGFLQMLNDNAIKVLNKNILILGTGGAARAVITACYEKSATRVDVVSRDITRAKEFITLHKERYINSGGVNISKSLPLSYTQINKNYKNMCELLKKSKKHLDNKYVFYDIIVKTTPHGMDKNLSLPNIDTYLIPSTTVVVDLIYNPRLTPFLKLTQARGCKVINGLSMLMHQGCKAYEIWTGQSNVTEDARSILNKYSN